MHDVGVQRGCFQASSWVSLSKKNWHRASLRVPTACSPSVRAAARGGGAAARAGGRRGGAPPHAGAGGRAGARAHARAGCRAGRRGVCGACAPAEQGRRAGRQQGCAGPAWGWGIPAVSTQAGGHCVWQYFYERTPPMRAGNALRSCAQRRSCPRLVAAVVESLAGAGDGDYLSGPDLDACF